MEIKTEEEYKKEIEKLKKKELQEKFFALRELRVKELNLWDKKTLGYKEHIENLKKALKTKNISDTSKNLLALNLGVRLYVVTKDKNFHGSLENETKDFLVIKADDNGNIYNYVVNKSEILGLKTYYEVE